MHYRILINTSSALVGRPVFVFDSLAGQETQIQDWSTHSPPYSKSNANVCANVGTSAALRQSKAAAVALHSCCPVREALEWVDWALAWRERTFWWPLWRLIDRDGTASSSSVCDTAFFFRFSS